MVRYTRVIFYHLLLRYKVVIQIMTSQQQHYCLLRVEEVDYQEPLPRKNGVNNVKVALASCCALFFVRHKTLGDHHVQGLVDNNELKGKSVNIHA
jgi:hypothetical protein